MPFRLYHPGMLKLLSDAVLARHWYRRRHSDSRRANEHRSGFYTEVWRDAAARLGATVEQLDKDVLEIRLGRACTRARQSTTAIDDPVTLSVAVNKPLVYRLLAKRGLRIPNYFEFTLSSIAQAVAFMRRFGGEWVVKPANGAAGRGVTTGVVTHFDLVRASVAAAAYESNLVVEQQVEGSLYRLLYLNGTLLDAVLRKSPAVVGDGRSSVRKLKRLENRKRLEPGRQSGQALLSIDLDMRRTLAKQNFSLSSVPKKGTVVTLKRVINENSVADNVSATSLLCKSIVEDGAAAAAAVGVRLAGVDVVTRDPGVPLAQSGGVILEVNTTPGYHYHYHQRDGGVAVAIPILSSLLFERPQREDVLMGQPLDAVMHTGEQ